MGAVRLAKTLGDLVFDTPLYRGAQKGIDEFVPNQDGLIFATPRLDIAEGYSIAPDRQVYELITAPGRSWDPNNPEDFNGLLGSIDTDQIYRELTDENVVGGAADYYKEVGKNEALGQWEWALREGNYASVEMPASLRAIREAGYDSFRVGEEQQLTDLNYGFFDPRRVKIKGLLGFVP